MFRQVQIGEKEVGLLANAATPYYYTMAFHEDFLEKATGNVSDAQGTQMLAKLGFIMAAQAEKRDMTKQTEMDFYAWLEQFEPMDLANAGGLIMEVYTATTKTHSIPK